MAQANNNSTQSPNVINDGDPSLLCRTNWQSILTFYLANYVAHCATVRSYPAEPAIEFSRAVVIALLFPLSGVIRAVDSIHRRAKLSTRNNLQRAARAGALCMVVRSQDWTPRTGERVAGIKIDTGDGTSDNEFAIEYPPWHYEPLEAMLSRFSISDRGCKVHGIHRLPPGYELTYVPSDTRVYTHALEDNISIEVASSYNLLKTAVAIFQVIYGAITLYRTRGTQIQQFGYASFGLTVTPYLVMSLLNLIGQLVTSDYSHLYMVDSPEMDEARSRGGVFDGTIGSLVSPQRPQGIEEWVFEAEINTEAVTDIRDEHPEPWAQNTSASEDVELGALTSSCTCWMVREFTTPESGNSRLLRFDTPKSFNRKPAKESYGHKIIIPRCSPYERLNSARFGRDLKSRSYHQDLYRKDNISITFTIPFAVSLISLIVNGALTHFQKGNSTTAQRAWTMSWLAINMAFGHVMSILSENRFSPEYRKRNPAGEVPKYSLIVFKTLCTWLLVCLPFGIFCVPAVGGLVVVGQMLSQFGNCERV